MYLDLIVELGKKKAIHEKEIQKYADAIQALQNICEHTWQYEGHGHDSSYYTCNKCLAKKEQ